MIPIGKRTDWNAIRAEYIAGNISQRKLAKKHGVSEGTLMLKANKEGWKKLRDDAESKAITRTKQKTADAIATNAVKLERAKGLAIDRLIKALEQMPEKSGTHSRQTIQEGGKRMTVDYDLIDIVVSLEKLTKNDTDSNIQPVTIVWARSK